MGQMLWALALLTTALLQCCPSGALEQLRQSSSLDISRHRIVRKELKGGLDIARGKKRDARFVFAIKAGDKYLSCRLRPLSWFSSTKSKGRPCCHSVVLSDSLVEDSKWEISKVGAGDASGKVFIMRSGSRPACFLHNNSGNLTTNTSESRGSKWFIDNLAGQGDRGAEPLMTMLKTHEFSDSYLTNNSYGIATLAGGRSMTNQDNGKGKGKSKSKGKDKGEGEDKGNQTNQTEEVQGQWQIVALNWLSDG